MRRRLFLPLLANTCFALTAITATAVTFKPEKLPALDSTVAPAISAGKLPGGVLWFERNRETYGKNYGHRAPTPAAEAATEDTIYDAASPTKAVATTAAAMQLVERGNLDLDATVAHSLPAFGQHGKDVITVRPLMTHMSGLRAGIPAQPAWAGYSAAIDRACAE